jgi:hypothetical protein
MYSHQIEQIASQQQAELEARTLRSAQAGWVRPVHQVHQSGRAAAPRSRRHPIRRRAGYALVSVGLRLATISGED